MNPNTHERSTEERGIDASACAMVQFLSGDTDVRISRPGEEEDEPAFLPEDILQQQPSVWVQQHISRN